MELEETKDEVLSPANHAQNKGLDWQTVLNDIDKEYANRQCSFSDLEMMAKKMLEGLRPLNFSALEAEMNAMVVHTYVNPTTFQLVEGLSKVQQYKNRLSEIAIMVEEEYRVRKQVNTMLFDANQAISKQSSADKRRGEATLRFPTLLLHFANIDAFKSQVDMHIANMRSTGETISRQITLIQTQISLGEYNRKTAEELGRLTADTGAEEHNDYKSGAPAVEWKDFT